MGEASGNPQNGSELEVCRQPKPRITIVKNDPSYGGYNRALGGTYQIRDILKSLGFWWNPATRTWQKNNELTEEDVKVISEYAHVTVIDGRTWKPLTPSRPFEELVKEFKAKLPKILEYLYNNPHCIPITRASRKEDIYAVKCPLCGFRIVHDNLTMLRFLLQRHLRSERISELERLVEYKPPEILEELLDRYG